ncbi:hypothetical protein [Streptomyces sp. NPDC093598]|uniref:hypothetical protein n=1 Tax=Streptomyces sp. NPDC093598 TaxID=3366046 RepID=UPI0037FD556F
MITASEKSSVTSPHAERISSRRGTTQPSPRRMEALLPDPDDVLGLAGCPTGHRGQIRRQHGELDH